MVRTFPYVDGPSGRRMKKKEKAHTVCAPEAGQTDAPPEGTPPRSRLLLTEGPFRTLNPATVFAMCLGSHSMVTIELTRENGPVRGGCG